MKRTCLFALLKVLLATYAPTFEKDKLVLQLQEELPIGTYVKTVVAIDRGKNEIFYKLHGPMSNYLHIKTVNNKGVIRVARRLDREAVDTNFKIAVSAAEALNPSIKSSMELIVYLTDINDNPPIFERSLYQISVPENTDIGWFVVRLKAHDLDLKDDPTPDLHYSILDGYEDMFLVEQSTGKVRVKRPLDFEKQKEYNIVVSVADGLHSSTAEVKVKVDDVNDRPPVFEHEHYQVSLIEATYKHHQLIQVNAWDGDININSPISYTILSGFNSTTFSIDSERVVYLSGVVDHEITPVIHAKIMAYELSPSNTKDKTSVASLSVNVVDRNDNKPRFTQQKYYGSVKENTVDTRAIVKCEVVDADKKRHSVVRYYLKDPLIPFEINTNGEILPKHALDREKQDTYNFKVCISQHPFADSCARVEIRVEDTNDHTPLFSEHIYVGVVEENRPPGTFLLTVSATDKDSGLNSKVRYSIPTDVHDAHRLFHVGANDGRIVTLTPLDYETKTQYTFLVRAQDQSLEIKRSAQVKVIIQVIDINDNIPVIENQHIFKKLPYDLPLRSIVAKIKANDIDSGNYSALRYKIANPTENSNLFKIDGKTGVIRTNEPLAPYSGAKFTLYITAYDNRGVSPSREGVGRLSVVVERRDGDTVSLYLNCSVSNVVMNEESIISELRFLLEVAVVTESMKNNKRCVYSFYAYSPDTYNLIPKEEILRKFQRLKKDALFLKFKLRWKLLAWRGKQQQESAAGMTTSAVDNDATNALIYAVLGVVATIVAFTVVVLTVVRRSRRRPDAYNDTTSSRLAIYSSQYYDWDDLMEREYQSYIRTSRFLEEQGESYEEDPSNLYQPQTYESLSEFEMKSASQNDLS